MRVMFIVCICLLIASCGRIVYPELYRDDGTGGWRGQFAAFDGVEYEDYKKFYLSEDFRSVLSYVNKYPSQKYSYAVIEKISYLVDEEYAKSDWLYSYVHDSEDFIIKNPEAKEFEESEVYAARVIGQKLMPKLLEVGKRSGDLDVLLLALAVDIVNVESRRSINFSNRKEVYEEIVSTASDHELIYVLKSFLLGYDLVADRYSFYSDFKNFLADDKGFLEKVKNNHLLYILTDDALYLNKHMVDIKNGDEKGEAYFFKDYFLVSFSNFDGISSFYENLKYCVDCDNNSFYEAISNASEFGRNLSLENFIDSSEYKYFFSKFGYDVSESVYGNEYFLEVSSNKDNISVKLKADVVCNSSGMSKEHKSVGFFEGLGLALGNPGRYASGKNVTYNQYDCRVESNSRKAIIDILGDRVDHLSMLENGFSYKESISTQYVWQESRPVYLDEKNDEASGEKLEINTGSDPGRGISDSLVSFYDGGYRSNEGHVIMILECRNKGRFSIFYDLGDSGQWKDGSGASYGNSFRGVPLNSSNAELFCNSR